MENVKNWVLKMEIGGKNGITVIGIPYKISCNNAGGDWDQILKRINYVFKEEEKIKILICQK